MAVGTKVAADQSAQTSDTEITLGTGKLLGIFFVAAVVCALFFGLGFNLGRASAPQADPNVATPSSSVASSTSKPSASHAAGVNACPAGQICSDATPSDPSASAASPQVTAPNNDSDSAPKSAAAPSPANVADASKPSPPPAAGAPAGSTFVVQVAAVSRREDADALTIALRKKSYPAFVVSDLPDKLFHIQVGPFEDRKQASDTRDKLTADGYNPIIK